MVIRAAKYSCYLKSRVVWDCSSNKGDRFHLKLNISGKPIAKKYCEGKVKRTLKRELKVLEIVKREANKNDNNWNVLINEKKLKFLILENF